MGRGGVSVSRAGSPWIPATAAVGVQHPNKKQQVWQTGCPFWIRTKCSLSVPCLLLGADTWLSGMLFRTSQSCSQPGERVGGGSKGIPASSPLLLRQYRTASTLPTLHSPHAMGTTEPGHHICPLGSSQEPEVCSHIRIIKSFSLTQTKPLPNPL